MTTRPLCRTGAALLLFSVAPCTVQSLGPELSEAVVVGNPDLCYILDGILLVYCIMITALFFKAKFSRPVLQTPDNSLYADLKKPSDQYDQLAWNSDPENGNVRQDLRRTEEVYTPLKPGAGDTYREIAVKKERRRNKNDMVYQDLSTATKDTPYDALQMYPTGHRR